LPKPERFHIVELIKKAPVGMLGCFTSGLLTSTFHSIGPVFASKMGLSVADISWFMTSAILGGLTLQWPIGKFSDRFDRIKVLSVLALFIAFLSILIMVLSRGSSSLLIIAIGLYGGFIFTIYPISVARAHDLFGPNEILPVTSTLLLVYGIGATAGPIVSSSFMTLTKTPLGFFIYSLVISCTFVLIAFSLRKKEKLGIVSVDEQVEFIPIRGTSTMALHIDPRAEEEIYDKFSS
jgi:MFS family permease